MTRTLPSDGGRRFTRLSVGVAALLGCGTIAPLAAQDLDLPWDQTAPLYAEAPPPESRHYEFLIGDWEIDAKRYAPGGAVLSSLRAEMHAEYVNDGRMVVSEWTGYSTATGEKVSHGITLRTYSSQSGRWQNIYLRSMSPTIANGWETERVGDEIRGGGLSFRVRFYDITADSYEWEQQVSLDGGRTWYLERTQSARRRPG